MRNRRRKALSHIHQSLQSKENDDLFGKYYLSIFVVTEGFGEKVCIVFEFLFPFSFLTA